MEKDAGLQQLLDSILVYDKNANISLIHKAYDFANNIHKGQKRISGIDFIHHPIEVAKIMALPYFMTLLRMEALIFP
jgi:guanosine-3',5'-bis(diphosphate) 3'-pyrophosphohydrolase